MTTHVRRRELMEQVRVLLPLLENAGGFIQEARWATGMTQKRLSELSGVSTPTITAAECHRKQPGAATLIQLLRALEQELSWQVERKT